ncbi:MAG TPA: hypothetical protein VGN12_27015 [Pirellulales bacterium]|jgi:hypothetical protein
MAFDSKHHQLDLHSLDDEVSRAVLVPWVSKAWYFGWCYGFPWGGPILLHFANRGNETAELLTVLAWPVLFLVTGMYIGTRRQTRIPPQACAAAIREIARHNARFSNIYNVGIAFLAAFEFAASIALSLKGDLEPLTGYAILTAVLFAPFAVLNSCAERQLLKGQLIALDVYASALPSEPAA